MLCNVSLIEMRRNISGPRIHHGRFVSLYILYFINNLLQIYTRIDFAFIYAHMVTRSLFSVEQRGLQKQIIRLPQYNKSNLL